MIKNNKKGLTLLEVVIVIAIIGIIMPLIFATFTYGFDTYNSYTRFMAQHDTATQAITILRRDIERATAYGTFEEIRDGENGTGNFKGLTLKFIDGNRIYYKFEEGELKYSLDGEEYNTVIHGLAEESVFYTATGRVGVVIQPEMTNVGKFRARNFTEPLTLEILVRYKQSS